MMSLPCVVVLVLAGVGHVTSESRRYIDLTHDLDKDAVFWPGVPSLNLTNLQKGRMPGGFWLEYNVFSVGEHGGTHMDAPAHFSENDWHTSDIPLHRLMGPGVVVDISERAKNNPDAQLTVEDLQKWEEMYGKIPSNAWVLLNSGWTKKWKDRAAFFGSTHTENSSTFHFPSISGDAARWLWENRPYITGVGLDTASIDSGPSREYPAHRALLPNRRIGLENVANLDQLPPAGAMIYAIPLKLKDGTGGPMRLFAVVGDGSSCVAAFRLNLMFVVTLYLAYIFLR